MTSIKDSYFMMKYNFYKEKDGIPEFAKVKYIISINNYCLVEDVFTKKRAWVSRYYIYPLNVTYYGDGWEYSERFEKIAIDKKLK